MSNFYEFLTHGYFEKIEDTPPGGKDLAFIYGQAHCIQNREYTISLTKGQLRRVRDALAPKGANLDVVLRPRGRKYAVKLNRLQLSACVRTLGLYDSVTLAFRDAVLDTHDVPENYERLHLLTAQARRWILANMVLLDPLFVVSTEGAHV